jgi:hypothetical protein
MVAATVLHPSLAVRAVELEPVGVAVHIFDVLEEP